MGGKVIPLQTMKQVALGNYFCLKMISQLTKLLCKTCDANRPNKDVKLKPKSLSNPLDQISSLNYQDLFVCAIKLGKIKIYLNGEKPKILFVDRELKPWHITNANLAVYTELELTMLLFRVQIKSHMIHFSI